MKLCNEIVDSFEGLRDCLYATKSLRELTKRSLDYIFGIGCKLSGLIVDGYLNCQGLNSEFVDLNGEVQGGGGLSELFDDENCRDGSDMIEYIRNTFSEKIDQRLFVVIGFLEVEGSSILQS